MFELAALPVKFPTITVSLSSKVASRVSSRESDESNQVYEFFREKNCGQGSEHATVDSAGGPSSKDETNVPIVSRLRSSFEAATEPSRLHDRRIPRG